jgi:DNA (cytosine-5)-methyltransferase 1
MNLRYGALFAGMGGLELGVQSVLGGTTAWHSEIEAAPSKILAHHWPDVPNLGDITRIDWTQVEPVDVLTGGSPCQDLSHAGKRAGMRAGTRSGLWASMCDAIDAIRPSLVVWENVRGALSACAHSDLEPCPGCVGDGPHDPVLRALGRVLGDLASLRYDAQWVGVRASDAGAPHGRFRVFVFAWPAADTAGADPRRRGWRGHGPGAAAGERDGWPEPGDGDLLSPADADRVGHQRPRDTRGRRPGPENSGVDAATDTARHGRHEGRPEPTRLQRGPHAPECGDAPAPDTSGQRHGRPTMGAGTGSVGRLDGEAPATGDQRERAREVPRDRSLETPTDTDAGTPEEREGDAVLNGRRPVQPTRARASAGAVAWGDYEPAIRRWERLTRPAPPPTEPSRNGAARLSPAFVEWMQGLPAGHVTAVPGLTRNDQLKALGNGCVPQQVALAVRLVLGVNSEVMPTVRPDLCEAI